MTSEIIPREKCRICKIYLPKDCINDICLKCSIHAAVAVTLVGADTYKNELMKNENGYSRK